MSCTTCYYAKRKCVPLPNSNKCERCTRLDYSCSEKTPKKMGRPTKINEFHPAVTTTLTALKRIARDERSRKGVDLMFTSCLLMALFVKHVKLMYRTTEAAYTAKANLKVNLSMQPLKVSRGRSPIPSQVGYVINIRHGNRTVFVGDTFANLFCSQSRAEELLARTPGYVSLWSLLIPKADMVHTCTEFVTRVVDSLSICNQEASTDASYSGVTLNGAGYLMYTATFVERRFYAEDFSTVQIYFELTTYEPMEVNQFAAKVDQSFLPLKRKR